MRKAHNSPLSRSISFCAHRTLTAQRRPTRARTRTHTMSSSGGRPLADRLKAFADRFAASVKQLELEADRLTKETKREAAKAAKLAEFQKAKAEIKIAKKKPKKAARSFCSRL